MRLPAECSGLLGCPGAVQDHLVRMPNPRCAGYRPVGEILRSHPLTSSSWHVGSESQLASRSTPICCDSRNPNRSRQSQQESSRGESCRLAPARTNPMGRPCPSESDERVCLQSTDEFRVFDSAVEPVAVYSVKADGVGISLHDLRGPSDRT